MVETTFAETLAQFETDYQAFIALARQYPAELRLQSGLLDDWSARDVLAQNAGWLQEALRRYPRFAQGTGRMVYQTETFNAVSVRMRRGKDYDDLLQEVIALSQKLVDVAKALSPERIARDSRYGEWLVALSDDVQTHTQAFEQFAERSQS